MRLLKHATFAVLATLALSSSAGMVTTEYVTFFSEGPSKMATGSLRDARDSGDSLQYIGCSMDVHLNGNIYTGCAAQDSDGNLLYCESNNYHETGAMQTINSASVISFSVTTDGQCFGVTTITGSDLLP